MTRKEIDQIFKYWINILGLGWWDIQIHHLDNLSDSIGEFGPIDQAGFVRLMNVDARWQYGRVSINVNLPEMAKLDKKDTEFHIVHELCHVLVNEMREGKLHHEERVVTGLTKAFLWVRNITRNEKAAK